MTKATGTKGTTTKAKAKSQRRDAALHEAAPTKSAAASSPAHGTFCWNELMAHDIARAKAFTGSILGWHFEPMPMQGGDTYWIIKRTGGHERGVGGLFEMKGPDFANMPEQWVSYIAVDDVDAAVAAAITAGAHVMKPAFDIPNVGRIACLRQPGGAMIYWMTPLMRG